MATNVIPQATAGVHDGMTRAAAAAAPCRAAPPAAARRCRIPARGLLAAALTLAASGMVQAQGADLAPFPAAEAGMQRFVVRVPPVSDDDARRVQLLVGRTIEVDCNRHALGGAPVQRRTVPGWGYDYLVVPALGPVASTRMACPPSEPRRREFVSAHLPDLDSLRYNPRLPLVIYAPAGAEVRYRIFQAGPEQAAAAE